MQDKCILVIDDQSSILGMLEDLFSREGYQVLTADDGEKGIHLAKTRHPDLICLDVNMPGCDGFDVYRAISTEHGKASIPVIIITGRSELEEVWKEIEVDGFFSKPFEVNELLAKVHEILSGESQEKIVILDGFTNPRVNAIAEAFEKERYKIFQTTELSDFERYIKTFPPKAILIEYMRRDCHGDAFIQKVRAITNRVLKPATPTPILVYSFSGMDYGEKSLHAGASLYLGKPENPEVIIEAVRTFEIRDHEQGS